MKLTKAQLKLQKEVDAVFAKEKLTEDEIEYIYENYNEGMLGDVSIHSAYFTPLDLAYDFALFAPRHGVVVDMCAGFGILSHCAKIRDTYHNDITHQICIERNPAYIEVGKKLLPTADWILGDMFDLNIWKGILKKYGRIDGIVSNPPFGKTSKTDIDRSWLKYKGADLDIASMEIAMKMTDNISMLLPKSSVSFRYSGRPYYEDIENKKIDKLKKESGIQFMMTNPGVDTSVYSKFKNTPTSVEHVDFMDIVLPDDNPMIKP